MTYAIVQSKRTHQPTDAASWTATFDNPTTSGNLLVAISWARDTPNNPMTGLGITDAGTNSWTSAAQQNHTVPGGWTFSRIGIHYVENCVGKATHIVTLTPTSSGTFSGLGDLEIFEISGIKTSGALDGAATSNAGDSTTPTGGSISPSGAGVHIAATGFGHFATITTTEDAGWDQLFDPATTYGAHAIYRDAANGVARNPGWTFNDTPQDKWSAVHAVFLEATAPAGTALQESQWLTLEQQTNPLTVSVW